MSNKVNRKAPTEAQKKKKDPLAKKRNAAKMLALILAVVMAVSYTHLTLPTNSRV